jgi:hypothetical protein
MLKIHATATDISDKCIDSIIRAEELLLYPKDGGRRLPRNAGSDLLDYPVPYAIRYYSSYSSL